MRLLKPKWRRKFLWVLGLIVLAFALAFPFLMEAINANRFGLFQYKTFNDVQDPRVTRYLPSAARNIIVDKQRQNFRAQYQISEAELAAYIDALWNKYGDRAKVPREKIGTVPPRDAENHAYHFGDLNWPLLSDGREYNSPRAGNGAGFFVWYSPSTSIAYERADYW